MDINKETNFQEWYVEILKKAEIVDARYNSKGMFVWLPYGFKIMRAIKEFWDKLFQDAGIQEYYFPEIVPLDYAQQNESWWQSFKDEGYKVVAGKNEIQGVIRPTGEPAMYPMFKLWIRTYTDLPLRLYQTSSAFRYESKSTHPLIRDREITIWHEIHTAHATEKGAENEAELHMQLWEKLWGVLALPIWKVKKPQWECFAGAVGAIEYYTLLPSGRVMETGSINNLGQAYAKKFDIKFKDANGKEDFVWQICTGVGARLLAAVIGIHGDNKGLILPPEIAQIKCVIVPIIFKGKEKSVIEKANEIEALLNKGGIATKVDMRDEIAAGSKFYEWEAKGVPIRIEIGPRDLEKNQITIVKRNDNKKIVVSENEVSKRISILLEEIQKELKQSAEKNLAERIKQATTLEEIGKIISQKNVARAFWCGDKTCYDKFSEVGEGVEGIGSNIEEKEKGKCVVCGADTKTLLFVGKSY